MNRPPRRADREQKTVAALVYRASEGVGVENAAIATTAKVEERGFFTGVHAHPLAMPVQPRCVSAGHLLKSRVVPRRVATIESPLSY